MRVLLLAPVVAVVGWNGGCFHFGGNPKPRNTVVLFAQMDARLAGTTRDTIIRSVSVDTFIVHLTLPDTCLRPNPPVPPCPPLLKATKTDTIIR